MHKIQAFSTTQISNKLLPLLPPLPPSPHPWKILYSFLRSRKRGGGIAGFRKQRGIPPIPSVAELRNSPLVGGVGGGGMDVKYWPPFSLTTQARNTRFM